MNANPLGNLCLREFLLFAKVAYQVFGDLNRMLKNPAKSMRMV